MIPIGLDLDKIKITFLMDLLNGNIDGSQSKWFVDNYYYKMDDIGYEGLAETLASEILKKSNINNFVEYKPILINYKNKEKQGCYSYNFIDNNKFLLPITHLFKKENEFGVLEQPYINHKYQIITFIDTVKNINKTQRVKKLEKKKRRLQRSVSRKYNKNKKGENYCKTSNIIKREKELLKIIKHLTNIRHNYLHQTTSEIIKRKPSYLC